MHGKMLFVVGGADALYRVPTNVVVFGVGGKRAQAVRPIR